MIEIESSKLLQQFASDNYAGICPEAWQAMKDANDGHVTSYGDDPWTGRASNAFRELFEIECDVYFVFNGTAANSLHPRSPTFLACAWLPPLKLMRYFSSPGRTSRRAYQTRLGIL
jgi:hypothetical protein